MSDERPIERWFFYQDVAGLWKWARLDALGTILEHSGASFDTREACVEHARHCGYREEWTSDLALEISPGPSDGSPSLHTRV